jgi:hypothetical protein
VIANVFRVAVVGVPLSCALSGCASMLLEGTSPAYLVIGSLEAATPGPNGDIVNVLQSDVFTSGHAREDSARVSWALALKDPGSVDLPSRPSPANAITITRYQVTYRRSDGRNVPGLDVPYPFDGALTITVGEPGASGTFVLVRAQAKLEAPLMTLRDSGGAVIISTLAEVTFSGRDQAGNVVRATGAMGVNFADWPDVE